MRRFSRRRYHRLSDLVRDLRELAGQRRQIRVLLRGDVVDAAFRERLMLAVTEVNGCRYCSSAHARTALAAGLTEADVRELAAGELGGSPPEQIPALLYARHWAETDATPAAEVRERVLETYGETKVRSIELALQMIRFGNLTGNTWDYLLCRASGGRWGDTTAA
jgi:AhpD family alkylhydroperoxidase